MTKQSGFSAVIVLLSILVVTTIGFTGYYVWNTQQEKKNDTSNQQSTTPVSQEQTDTNNPPADTQKYLVINEWGVKIPLNDQLKDLTYRYNKSESTVTLTSTSLINYQKDLASSQNVSDLGGLGLLSSSPMQYDLEPGQQIPNDGPFIGYYMGKANGASVVFTPPSQSSCPFSNNETYNLCTSYEKKQAAQLIQILKNIGSI